MLNIMFTETNGNMTDPDGSTGAGEEHPVEATPPGYDLMVIFRTIGHASSTCECCGTLVDGETLGEWIICDLDVIDFSDESHALVCLECYETKDWEARVKENRLDRQINSRLDKFAHWVTRAPVETLFLRRAGAGIALLLTATTLTTIMTALASGLGPLWDYLSTTNFALIGGLGLAGLVLGYWLHLHEREKNDHRGTTVRELNITDGPWSVLAVTSGGMALGTAAIALAPTSALSILGFATYVASVVFAFKNLEVAVRADRCHQRVHWVPRYDRELFGLRVSTIIGMGSLLVGISPGALVPVVAVGAYLFARKWYDLGENWRLLYRGDGSDSGGDD